MAQDFQVTMLGLAWLHTALDDLAQPRSGASVVAAARSTYESARTTLCTSRTPAAIDRLSRHFGLAPFDEDCLLLAAAARLDPSFTDLFTQTAGGSAFAHATPHLAMRLLAAGGAEAVQLAFGRLSPVAPLRHFRLLEVDGAVPSLVAPLETDERMARYLIGDDYPDALVQGWLLPLPPAPCPLRHRSAAKSLARSLSTARSASAAIIGPANSGRVAVAQAVARHMGLTLMALRPRDLPERGPLRHAALALLARETTLCQHALMVDASDEAGRDEAADLVRQLEANMFVIAHEPIEGTTAELRLSALETRDRVDLWQAALPSKRTLTPEMFERIAEQFALGPSAISAIARTTGADDEATLWSACRDSAGRGLDALAERLAPRFGWQDIVLPRAIAESVQAIAAQVHHRASVYGRGGFGRKLVRSRGVTALFAGPSGTGKTMAAEVIAGDLGLDLCRVDLSGVVSKYIGETERNLKRVFDAAEAGGVVLFFDEADALFGKRSEVKDSHDRYANIEISYLLQRMETYSGLAVLATNLKSNLDPAFLRRLRHVVDFPFPDAGMRRTIWERSFPSETTCRDLDLDALARMEIAGGNIAVIAVNAAFMAASEGKPVDMAHIARAARAEFRKLEKEFRPLWPEAR